MHICGRNITNQLTGKWVCNMKEKLMHKYALSSQGAKDMIKAFISVTISDLILMIPVSLL